MRKEVLSLLADPNYAWSAVVIGALAVYGELCAPGKVWLGAIGGVLVLTGLYSLCLADLSVGAIGLGCLAFAATVLAVRWTWVIPFAWVELSVGVARLRPSGENVNVWLAIAGSVLLTTSGAYLLRIGRQARTNKAQTFSLFI